MEVLENTDGIIVAGGDGTLLEVRKKGKGIQPFTLYSPMYKNAIVDEYSLKQKLACKRSCIDVPFVCCRLLQGFWEDPTR